MPHLKALFGVVKFQANLTNYLVAPPTRPLVVKSPSLFSRPACRRLFTAAMTVPSIKLSSGHEMPQVGFGLWKVDNATCADTVYNAIKTGYRLFDGACGKFVSPPAPAPTGTHITRSCCKAIKPELTLPYRLWQRSRSRPGCRPCHQRWPREA
jgi:hypothetical protein